MYPELLLVKRRVVDLCRVGSSRCRALRSEPVI
jgi:hypothetical protein